jgi:SET domain-containing protein
MAARRKATPRKTPLRKPALPPGCEVRDSPGRGRGVFALRAFRRGELIDRVPVLVIPGEQWEHVEKTRFDDYCFRWGHDDEHGALVLGTFCFVNHSYDPNATVTSRIDDDLIDFVARRAIAAGDEVTINYNGDPRSKRKVWFEVR